MKLHPRSQKILEYVIAYKRAHDGNAPTVRDIGAACGISSTGVVNHHLKQLVRAGEMYRDEDGGLCVTNGHWTQKESSWGDVRLPGVLLGGPLAGIRRADRPECRDTDTADSVRPAPAGGEG